MQNHITIAISSFRRVPGGDRVLCANPKGAGRCPFLTDRSLWGDGGRSVVKWCKLFGEEIDAGQRCDGCIEAENFKGATR